jgi:ubiquinol-cytochrome c reductase cytochrome c1 subunit
MPIAAEDTLLIPKEKWSFQGPTGAFKRDELQRGYQVYKEVCAACHGLKLVSYNDLKSIGLPKEAIKALAAAHEYPTLNDEGQPIQRKGIPSDKLLSPFPNEKAARAANNGALPPDLSLLAKARAGGPDYLHALLIGYHSPPAGFTLSTGMHYNAYFPGHQIAMPAPLSEGQVTYADGTKATVDQMAHDVVTFLSWAAEPELEARKQTGLKVLFYLIFLTGIFYLSKRKIWKDLKSID